MRIPRKVQERALEAFRDELEALPLEVLVDVADAVKDAGELRWREISSGPRRGLWLTRWAEDLETETLFAVRFELAQRAAELRADLVERLTTALDAGDVAAFAAISAEWRALPACLRDFIRAWNGVDVPFFDPWKGDIEPDEFLPSAVRRRVVEAVRAA